MKLKARIWLCNIAVIVILCLFFLLNFLNIQNVTDTDSGQMPHNSFDTAKQRSAHVAPADHGDRRDVADHGDVVDEAEHGDRRDVADHGDRRDVADLVHAIRSLARRTPLEQSQGGANAEDNYKDLARKLLQEKSFDVAEDLIHLGKYLQASINNSGGDGKNDTDADPDGSRSNNVITEDEVEVYPVFHLERAAILSLAKHITRKSSDHQRLKMKIKTPLSFKLHKGVSIKPWQQWQNSINQHKLYDDTKPYFKSLLRDMAYGSILSMTTMPDYGTQIKLIFKFHDGSQSLFKPMRWKRDQERDPNLYYFDDFERHHAEIAAFHLDRVMQFYRVPPNIGRFINITTTVEPFSTKSFKKTIYISPSGNKCFYGKCDYYCDSGHAVCGQPDVVEGSMAAWLPFGKGTTKKSWENPWRRSYSKFRKAAWENDTSYCDTVKQMEPYDSGRRLLDLMDITIFDYLAANQDRHHFHTFKVFGNNSSPVLYDNGRGFGVINFDDQSILVPVTQCCQIRFSTLTKLVRYEMGSEKLSVLMRSSLAQDPVSSGPNGHVLSEGHLRALDRRVSKVLDAVWDCVQKHGEDKVILDDGY